LDSTSSQRGESSEIINGQLSFKRSAKNLSQKVLSILKDLVTDEDNLLCQYIRTAQLDLAAFKHLICTISNYALTKIEEWHKLRLTLLANPNIYHKKGAPVFGKTFIAPRYLKPRGMGTTYEENNSESAPGAEE
jgi:hypothetical protein